MREKLSNNAMNTDSEKQCVFVAPLFTAGYGDRWATQETILKYRVAIKSDAEQIAHLHADSWRRTYRGRLRDDFLDGEVVRNRIGVWNERLGSVRADQFVLVAENQKQVLGFYGGNRTECCM